MWTKLTRIGIVLGIVAALAGTFGGIITAVQFFQGDKKTFVVIHNNATSEDQLTKPKPGKEEAAVEAARLKAEGDKAKGKRDKAMDSETWGIIGTIATVVAAIAAVAAALFALVALLFLFSSNRKLEKLLGPKGVTALSEPSTARGWIMKGLELYDYKKGNFLPPDQAIHNFSKAIEVDANNALAYALRARATLSKFDLEGGKNKQLLSLAIQDASSAVRIDADQPFAYFAKGNLHLKAQQFKKANLSFDEAIRHDPNFAAAYNNRGNSYNRLKEHRRAIEDYDKAIQLDPNNPFAYNNRGNSYTGLKEHWRAIEDYDKAIQLDPNYAPAYRNRGISQEDAGR